MSSQRTDLAEQLASMPELQALLTAERAAMEAKVEALKKEHALAAQHVVDLTVERDKLRASHERLWVEVELFKRRLFIAKAERADNETQLRIEYEEKLRELDAATARSTSRTAKRPSQTIPRRPMVSLAASAPTTTARAVATSGTWSSKRIVSRSRSLTSSSSSHKARSYDTGSMSRASSVTSVRVRSAW